ncbi:hypothetical protein BU24DRAFT_141757 [Aaosphaeria arxii CBS 175.79]|uniref:Plasma membrane fusion protein PRM1 n=1 Tax=Aaosphaeria arxii CBS 175.79 TaxID=1450172 RepID=A0A6A5XUF3_9PLEO|nr:uncharacterized protein BU24DRAFT_141757 [Aaosphaeria arxii CBS 175.79]KAF2016995.1 hypothetical protein BU24DRAFT_141757 [Aaosphaeria arxii CBS 175.79]
MASTVNQQQPFPAVPPSLSAGDHEMRDYYAPHDAPRPTINRTPYLTPYLGLRARLSQIWINRWTILLLLVLVRLLFAIAGTNSSLSSARREALSACTQVENIGSSMASMPHYMAQGMNEMTATSVEKAISGLMQMLELSVTAVEEIIIFVIHMMTSTYLCLITLAVRGSMKAAVEIGEKISEGLNKTIDEVTDSMGDATKTVTDGINSILDKIQSLPFTDDFKPPTIDLSNEITKLKALEAPPEIQEGINKLNGSIPTFDQVQNFTDTVLRFPFEEVKKLIRGLDKYEFNRTLLPVPQKERLTFCSEGNSINSFFDELIELGITGRRIALAVLIVAAILVCVPMAWIEIRRYRQMKEHAELFQKGHDGMDVVYFASRPHSASWGLWLGQRFGSERRQTIVRWAWAYATSVPMLLLLALGIAGLFSCLCQYLLVRAIQKKVPELTGQVADFAEKVITSLDASSMSWSNGVNGVIDKLDSEINEDIFGWVNTTTEAVNGTLNTFVEEMSKTLDTAFGDTILRDPIGDVLNCLIGLKIASFQKGLTWVRDHAHVGFPGVRNDSLSISALANNGDSSSAAELLADPNGKARDEITEAVDYVVGKIISGIITEALISTALICIYLLIALGGVIYACTLFPRRNRSVPADPYIINPVLADENAPKSGPNARDYPETAAPPYEYHTTKPSYTITPRPFRTTENNTETVGQVAAQHSVIESAHPGHARSSSHGHFADPSPLDEKSNPFASPTEQKRNPFH